MSAAFEKWISDRESRAKEANGEGHEAFREGSRARPIPLTPGTLEWWAWDVGWRVEQNLVAWERSQFRPAAE